jgi:hypothetical protein
MVAGRNASAGLRRFTGKRFGMTSSKSFATR